MQVVVQGSRQYWCHAPSRLLQRPSHHDANSTEMRGWSGAKQPKWPRHGADIFCDGIACPMGLIQKKSTKRLCCLVERGRKRQPFETSFFGKIVAADGPTDASLFTFVRSAILG